MRSIGRRESRAPFKFVLCGLLAALFAGCSSTPTALVTPTATVNTLASCSVTPAELLQTAKPTTLTAPNAHLSGSLNVEGDVSLVPLFQRVASAFDTANATHITVANTGTGQGLGDTLAGTAQVGIGPIFPQYMHVSGNVTDHQVAALAYTLVVNADLASRVRNLSSYDINFIANGEFSNWNIMGGPNDPITFIQPAVNSSMRGVFEQYVWHSLGPELQNTLTFDGDAAILHAVSTTPGAIGYVSTQSLLTTPGAWQGVAPVCLDNAKADAADIASGHYPFWTIEHAYTAGPATGLAEALLSYVESDTVQTNVLSAFNLYRLGPIAPAALTAHTPAGAAHPESFYPRG